MQDPTNAIGWISRTEYEIVGVVDDVHYVSVDATPEPAVYFAQAQNPFRRMFVTISSNGRDATALTDDVRSAVREVEAGAAIEFTTMEVLVDRALSMDRLKFSCAFGFKYFRIQGEILCYFWQIG